MMIIPIMGFIGIVLLEVVIPSMLAISPIGATTLPLIPTTIPAYVQAFIYLFKNKIA